jgi:hypothetical protein
MERTLKGAYTMLGSIEGSPEKRAYNETETSTQGSQESTY